MDLLSKYSAFIFDFDGTLADTAPDILSIIKTVIRDAGIKVPACSTEIIGPPLEQIFASLLPGTEKEQLNSLVAAYRAKYRTCGFPFTRVFTGIPNILQQIYRHGKPAFIATNKPCSVSKALLESKSLLHFFKDVVSRDSIPGRCLSKRQMLEYLGDKYSLNASSALMIGDSVLDMEGARQAGMCSAAVLYGYGSPQQLRETGPDLLILTESWDDIAYGPGMRELS